jgi:hypothetical protein
MDNIRNSPAKHLQDGSLIDLHLRQSASLGRSWLQEIFILANDKPERLYNVQITLFDQLGNILCSDRDIPFCRFDNQNICICQTEDTHFEAIQSGEVEFDNEKHVFRFEKDIRQA